MNLTKLHPKAKTKGTIEFQDKCPMIKTKDGKKAPLTGTFRLSYPHLFKPNEFKGKKSWSIQMLFEKDTDLTPLLVAAQNAAIEEWGSDVSKWPSKKIKSKKTGKIIMKSLLRSPFRDGDLEMPDKEEYADHFFIGASCAKRAPEVFTQSREPITEDDGTIKAGDYCRAKIIASAYEVEGSAGVKFTLLAVQKVKTGEALGGGGSSVDDFDDLEDDELEDIDQDDEENDSEEDEDTDEDEDDEEDEKPKKGKKAKRY